MVRTEDGGGMSSTPKTRPVPSTRYVGCQIRLYPNNRQAVLLRRSVDAGRELWNAMLEATLAHQDRTGKFLGPAEREQFVKHWKQKAPVALDVPAAALYRIARDMGRAFSLWQKRRAKGKRGGFPKYRSRYARQAGIYQEGRSTHLEPGRVRLLKIGWLRWRGGDLPQGRLVSGRVWCDAGGRWMLSLAFDCPPPRRQAPAVEKMGVAVCGPALATVYDGAAHSSFASPDDPSPRVERRLEELERLIARSAMRCGPCGQQMPRAEWMALRTAGNRTKAPCGHHLAAFAPSARSARLQERRGVLHRKMRLRRRDAAHKASTAIVRRAGQLHVASLYGAEYDPGGRDAVAAEFLRQIRYKAAWHRRRLVVPPDQERPGPGDRQGWLHDERRAQEKAAAHLYRYEPPKE